MKIKIAEENAQANELIPPAQPDGSGVGVNYVDAYIKPLNTTLEDGTSITCKRKGLKITLKVGDHTGESLLRKRENGPDIPNILRCALNEAAEGAGVKMLVEDGVIYIEK